MNKIKTYEDLIVWKQAIELSKNVYFLLRDFPKHETFGLCDQIRRAVVSIPSNIAEGFGRNSNNDFKRFLSIALGSVYELQTQLKIASELSYISTQEYELIIEKSKSIDRMLFSLIRKLSERNLNNK